MTGNGGGLARAARGAVLISALTVGMLAVVLAIYIVYVYALWMQAMRSDAAPGLPPP